MSLNKRRKTFHVGEKRFVDFKQFISIICLAFIIKTIYNLASKPFETISLVYLMRTTYMTIYTCNIISVTEFTYIETFLLKKTIYKCYTNNYFNVKMFRSPPYLIQKLLMCVFIYIYTYMYIVKKEVHILFQFQSNL